jgi:O-antigen/teichoic acid export membrane protein
MYINAPIGNILYNSDKISKFIPYAVLNTSLNIILNFVFIKKWGYIGASTTTLITEITGFLLQIWLIKKIPFPK